MKENIRIMESSDELGKNNKSIRENREMHKIKKIYCF